MNRRQFSMSLPCVLSAGLSFFPDLNKQNASTEPSVDKYLSPSMLSSYIAYLFFIDNNIKDIYGASDWRRIAAEAAFIPVIHSYGCIIRNGIIQSSVLTDSIKSIQTVIDNTNNSDLSQNGKEKVWTLLSSLPSVDLTRKTQSQTAQDQFFYNTMHIYETLPKMMSALDSPLDSLCLTA